MVRLLLLVLLLMNLVELLEMDLWGVPSFRVNDLPGYWGQDRLWMVEQDLMALR